MPSITDDQLMHVLSRLYTFRVNIERKIIEHVTLTEQNEDEDGATACKKMRESSQQSDIDEHEKME